MHAPFPRARFYSTYALSLATYIMDMYVLLYIHSYNHATPSAAHAGGGNYNCDDYMFMFLCRSSSSRCRYFYMPGGVAGLPLALKGRKM